MRKIKKYDFSEIKSAAQVLVNLEYEYSKALGTRLTPEEKNLKNKKSDAIEAVLTALGAQITPAELSLSRFDVGNIDEKKQQNFVDAYSRVKEALKQPDVVAGVSSSTKKALEKLSDSLSMYDKDRQLAAIDAKIIEYKKRVDKKEEFGLTRSGFFSKFREQPEHKKASVKLAACEKLKEYIDHYFDSKKPMPRALNSDELKAVKDGTLNDLFSALPKALHDKIKSDANSLAQVMSPAATPRHE